MQDRSRRKMLSLVAGGTAVAGFTLFSDFGLAPAFAQGSRKLRGYLRTNWGNPITTLADKSGLKRVVTKDDSVIRGKKGRKISSFFAPFWISRVQTETAMGVEFDKVNVKEMEAAYNAHGIGYEGQDVLFPNGYDKIFSALEGDYRLHLSQKVTAINHGESGVKIETGDGAPKAYDAAIVTVPLGVLKKGTIAFNPPLSAKKTAAITRMGMGYFDKLYLLFEEVFWDEKATWITTPENGLPRGQFNYWVNLKPYVDSPILLAINGGTSARKLSDESDETLIKHATRTLELAYPV